MMICFSCLCVYISISGLTVNSLLVAVRYINIYIYIYLSMHPQLTNSSESILKSNAREHKNITNNGNTKTQQHNLSACKNVD